MSRLKRWAVVAGAALVALLLALLRHRNGKLAGLKAELDLVKENILIKEKHAELKKAEVRQHEAKTKFDDWEKEYESKYGKDGDSSPPDDEL